MNDFLLIFRRDVVTKEAQPSPEEMQASVKRWQDWLGGIAAQGKMVSKPGRWDGAGKVVRQSIVTNGPYAEVKESIGGVIIIKAENYDEATEIAKGCPILLWGGNVEIRMSVSPDESI
jgi:hypothetical protein